MEPDPDTFDPVRDTASALLSSVGLLAGPGAVDAFCAAVQESQKPQWDSVRVMMVCRVDPVPGEAGPDGEFPPHTVGYDMVPVTAQGDMMMAIVPTLDGRSGKIRSAAVGAAYVMGWAYGKWEMTQ